MSVSRRNFLRHSALAASAAAVGRVDRVLADEKPESLSPAEKLQLVEDLWDDLAATPEGIPVHDWQRQELARRKANLKKHPASGLTWEEVKQRVRRRHGS